MSTKSWELQSYATLLCKFGMDWKSVQVLTRHSTIETLAKYYMDDHERAGESLENISEGWPSDEQRQRTDSCELLARV